MAKFQRSCFGRGVRIIFPFSALISKMSPSFIPSFFLNSAGIVIRPYFPTFIFGIVSESGSGWCLIKNNYKSEQCRKQDGIAVVLFS